MSDSAVDVANKALALLGEPAISSFEDDSETAEKVNLLYETTILTLLGMREWHFAKTRAVLEEDGAAPSNSGWARGFLLPAVRTVRVGQALGFYIAATQNAPKLFQYEVRQRWCLTNATVCVCEYIARVPETDWPGYFEKLAIQALAAEFALPVTENQTRMEVHQAIAYGSPGQGGRGGLFKVASDADDIGSPTVGLLDDDDPIAAARFG